MEEEEQRGSPLSWGWGLGLATCHLNINTHLESNMTEAFASSVSLLLSPAKPVHHILIKSSQR